MFDYQHYLLINNFLIHVLLNSTCFKIIKTDDIRDNKHSMSRLIRWNFIYSLAKLQKIT